MPKAKSRQQRRARARSPLKAKRRGSTLFLAFMLIVLLGGIGLAAVFRTSRPPITRGAIIGEHWHAKYVFNICGKTMTVFPTVEGELHSHADGFIHIHPHTQAAAGDLASLGTFLRLYETTISESPDGKRSLTFPDGTSYKDGDRCPKDKKRYDIQVSNKGEEVEGDPSMFLPHDDDEIAIIFGAQKTKGSFPNPYAKARGLPDPGTVPGQTPAPDSSQPTPPPAVPASPASD